MRIGTIVIGFVLVGALLIVMNNNIDMAEKDGQKEFFGSFLDWLKQVGKNTINVVGHVVSDYDWMPDKNETASENLTIEDTDT